MDYVKICSFSACLKLFWIFNLLKENDLVILLHVYQVDYWKDHILLYQRGTLGPLPSKYLACVSLSCIAHNSNEHKTLHQKWCRDGYLCLTWARNRRSSESPHGCRIKFQYLHLHHHHHGIFFYHIEMKRNDCDSINIETRVAQ